MTIEIGLSIFGALVAFVMMLMKIGSNSKASIEKVRDDLGEEIKSVREEANNEINSVKDDFNNHRLQTAKDYVSHKHLEKYVIKPMEKGFDELKTMLSKMSK